MHILIDARFYGPFGKGLGRYVQKLVEHLERIPHDHRLTIALRRENWNDYTPHDGRFRKILVDVPWYSLREQLVLPSTFLKERPDLVHFPHYNVPLLFPRPFVVTIHDLIVSRYPTLRATTLPPFFYQFKQRAYGTVIRSAIRRARRILTVSEYSKRIIASTFRVPPEKVVVTYEAAEPLTARNGGGAQDDRHTLNRLRVPGDYLLYVGNAYPHKNLEGLLRAFAAVRRSVPNLSLVLVGKMDYFYRRIAEESRQLGLADAVVFPGYVTDEELVLLYRHARLYVFPSFEEGFGLPPLEAMVYGVPVASSNASCLPEILGDAAAYFPPHDTSMMAKALMDVLGDEAWRKELARRGRERVQRYQWETLARTTLDVYTGH